MLNRRHLRIKVLQALYAYFQSDEDNLRKTETELMKSVERIYDLYLYLLLSFGELKELAEYRMDENKKKIRPGEEDLNPNRKFADNKIIEQLLASYELRLAAEERSVNWIGDENREMFRKIFIQMRESESWFTFMGNGMEGFEEDQQFAMALFKNEIANSEILYHYFEEKNIHWIDDIDLACGMVVKTIKAATEDGKITILLCTKTKKTNWSLSVRCCAKPFLWIPKITH